ncbi:MAG: toll/interleukin-1 receptor domain-containing protein, partial [Nodosilinea sp.]
MTENQFDAFLSHSSKDKPLIRQIHEKLRNRGIYAWFDEDKIVPGDKFQTEIGKAINTVSTAVICIGKEDLGQWQELESEAFVSLSISKSVRIIPVLLPGVEDVP